jgi:hypothetical protein
VHKYRSRNRAGGIGWRLLISALTVAAISVVRHQPVAVTADTFLPHSAGCVGDSYQVPAGSRYIQVVSIGGTGGGGASYNSNNTGGSGGSGAKVTAIVPVTSGQLLRVNAGQNGDDGGSPNGGAATPFHAATQFTSASGGKGGGGGSSVVTALSGDPCLDDAGVSRDAVLVLAGGGGGGGGGNTFGSGGNGGGAGGNADFSGQGAAARTRRAATAPTAAGVAAAQLRLSVVRASADALPRSTVAPALDS